MSCLCEELGFVYWFMGFSDFVFKFVSSGPQCQSTVLSSIGFLLL